MGGHRLEPLEFGIRDKRYDVIDGQNRLASEADPFAAPAVPSFRS
jgi:hypothetical protein